jgi:hypothetical protein
MYAALAARNGYRVGVIGHGAKLNTYRHQGQIFLKQNEFFYGFSTSPAVARVFGELAMEMEIKNRPRPLDPIVQLVLPTCRIDMARDEKRWLAGLEREFNEGRESLLTFEQWAEHWTKATNKIVSGNEILPPHGFRAAQRYQRLIEGCEQLLDGLAPNGVSPLSALPHWESSRALVEGTLSHVQGVRTGALPPLAVARLWTHLRAGLYRMPGGLDGMKELFVAKLREQCGDHRPSLWVDEIIFKRRKNIEVCLGGRGERLGCNILVANMKPERFFPLISQSQRNESFHSEIVGKRPLGWHFTINVGVDTSVIPAGMGPEVVLIEQPRQSSEPVNSIWISRPAAAPSGVREGRPGPGVLSISAIHPAGSNALTAPSLQRSVDHAMEKLRCLIPWLDGHLETVHVPALGTNPSPDDSDEQMLDVSALRPILASDISQTADITALASRTPYRGVLLGGETLCSGLGFEGACLGAIHLLKETQQSLKLKVLRPDA